jgi:hypothetical protein
MEYPIVSPTPELLPLGLTEYVSSFTDVTKFVPTQGLCLKHPQLPEMPVFQNILKMFCEYLVCRVTCWVIVWTNQMMIESVQCGRTLCEFEIMWYKKILIKSDFMLKVWNNANLNKFSKNHICFIPVGKLVLNYVRFSRTHDRMKYDLTV